MKFSSLGRLKPTDTIDDRFKLAMIPATLLGILTNVYIFTVMVIVKLDDALVVPVAGSILFLAGYFFLKRNILQAKLVFLITAYTVVVEVCIHTHFLGWESGFFYFMFLLPTVFLLNSSWRPWMIVVFNASIVVITGMLRYTYHSAEVPSFISAETLEYVNFLNMGMTCLVVIVIMIYFSRTIHKKDEALMDANTELERQNKEILEQHKHQKILLKEIHHRVKNNLQIISSLMSLQQRNVDDADVAEVLNDSKRRVEAIALIHQKLYQDDKVNRVNFNSYLDELMVSQELMSPNVKCILEADEAVLSLDIAVPLGLIVSEMITNSIKHGFLGIDNPELWVTLTRDVDEYKLVVRDNGVGLPANFNLEEPTSLGTEIIGALTGQIDAKIDYSNENGAKFQIYFKDRF
jgi:two-component sensor histidine kinase